MYAVTFIRLIENEYLELFKECSNLKEEIGFDLFEKPTYICDKVQKFRNWLIMAIRSSEVVKNGTPMKPEDVLIEAATAKHSSTSSGPIHQNLINSLTLFNKTDLDGIMGEKRRLELEQAIGYQLDKCKYEVCSSHCEFLQGTLRTKVTGQDSEKEQDPEV